MPQDIVLTGQTALIPSPIAAAGPNAVRRFLEFFTANIRNPNTRASYARAVADFFRWCQRAGLHELRALEPVHVAAEPPRVCRRLFRVSHAALATRSLSA